MICRDDVFSRAPPASLVVPVEESERFIVNVHFKTRPLVFGAVFVAEGVEGLGEVSAPHLVERGEIVRLGKEGAKMLLKEVQLMGGNIIYVPQEKLGSFIDTKKR